MNRLTELDGLRGFFAFMIVLYHLPQKFDVDFGNNLIISNAFIFVDYFFCLSGFVITMIYANALPGKKSLNDFLIKRVIRIYPLHLLILMLYLAGFLILQYPIDYFLPQLTDSLFLTNSTPVLGSWGINPVSWSISSEMISYVLFGVVFLLTTRKALVTGVILLLCLAMISMENINFFSTNDFGFLRGTIGFGFGVLLNLYCQKTRTDISRHYEILVPALLIVLLWTINSVTYRSGMGVPYGNLINALITPVIMCCSILIILRSRGGGVISWILNSKPMQELGLISYSVYMIHPFIFSAIEVLMAETSTEKYIHSFLFVPSVAITVLICAKFSFHIIENHLGKILTKHAFPGGR